MKMKKSRKRKILWGLMGGLLGLLFLFVVALLLLPHFVNVHQVKARILARVSREIHGQVDFEKVEMRFFPPVEVVIHRGTVRIPQKVDLSLEAFRVRLSLLPLLRGRVVPARVEVAGLTGWVRVRGEGKGPSQGPAITDETLKSYLRLLSTKAPGLSLSFQGHHLVLYRALHAFHNKELILTRFKGDLTLPPSRLTLDFHLSSPHLKELAIEGWLGTEDLAGEVKAHVKDLSLSAFMSWFTLDSSRLPTKALISLNLEGRMEGLEHFAATVKGSVPCLVLKEASHLQPFSCSSFEAHITREKRAWSVALDGLSMKYPRLNLKGEFSLDPDKGQTSLTITGTQVDVPSVRRVALALMGDNYVVGKIFEIVRAGKVSTITFMSRGVRLGDLDNLDSMTIQASLVGGTVDVPSVHLLVEDVGGNVLIQRGILHGQNLVGRLGNSRLLEGTLRVDLRHENPFRLEANLDADLSQLPGVLNQVLRGGLLLEEIQKVKNVQGKALGTLVVGHDGHRTRVEVDAREVSLSCNYSRVPYPIKILGGTFSYRDSQVQVGNIRGYLGKSVLKGLSARMEWGGPKGVFLKVSSMRGGILLDEIYPWITSYTSVREALKEFSSMKGWLQVASLTFQGPVSQPRAWKFRLEGRLQDFAMDFSLFPGTLKVKRGGISMTPERLSFRGCYARLLDASTVVSGSLGHYLQGVDSLELDLDGRVGPRAAHWVYGFIQLDEEYRVRAPFLLKKTHLLWKREGMTGFSGEVLVGGSKANLDLELVRDILLVKRLSIEGMGSRATLGLTFQGKTLSLNFKGRVGKRVLDTILEKNLILKGEVKGDFDLYMVLKKAMQFSARGFLHVEGLTSLWGLKMPLTVEEASLKAHGAGLDIESTRLSLRKSSVELKGNAGLLGKRLRLNLDLSAPSLDVQEIEEIFSGSGKPKKRWDIPLEGEVRAKVFSLFYDGYTWSPVDALVSISPNQVRIDVKKALICGISTPGVLTFSPGHMEIETKVEARKKDLEETLGCFLQTPHLAEGTFDVRGYLKASGTEDPLTENSTGAFNFTGGKGRIYKFDILSKVFSVIGVTQIFRGKLPILDLGKKGFGYSSIKARGRFKNGILLLDEFAIDGDSARVFANGKIDVLKDRMDVTVLVAPFSALGSFISKVPILGYILTGKSKTLLSVPVKVSGSLKDPKVIPLSPLSVGSGILGIVKRTFEAPVKLIAPNMGKEKTAPQPSK